MFAKYIIMKKKILLADDDESIREILKIILEREGYVVQVKPNGFFIDDEPLADFPDLYLLDRQLSGVDGLDVCRHLKSLSATSKIPVVMISANPDIGALSLRAGADGYIEKPFKMNELLNKIVSFLG